MKQYARIKKQLVVSVLLTAGCMVCGQSQAVAPHIRDVVVFKGGEGGSNHYRIPSIVVAADGSLVAFAQGMVSSGDPGQGKPISIKSRRSTDNGATWSDYQVIHGNATQAWSDPRPFLDKSTGRLFIFYTQWDMNCAQNGNCVPFDDPAHKLLYRVSDDNGQTWSEATDILHQIRDTNWMANGTSASNGRATWSVTPTDQQIQDAAQKGWSLAWNSRVATGSCNVQYYGNGNTRFLVDLQVGSDMSVSAMLYTDSGQRKYPLGYDVSGYHDYQITGSGDSATFYVDGKAIATHWQGQTHTEKTVTWGNGCSSTQGATAIHAVEFRIADKQLAKFDASLMKRVGSVINHPAQQGWIVTSASNGRGDPGWKSVNAGPGQGIQLASGRLIFPAIVLDAFSQLSVVSIYSDDHGLTWRAGNQTPTWYQEPSEADMVELRDGRILLSARNDGVTGEGNFNRYQYLSSDGGINWTIIEEQRHSTNGALFFKLNQVDIGLLRYGENRVLMSGPQGANPVSSDRNNLAIWSAREDGAGNYNFTQRTWFRDGFTAYSDLIALLNKGTSGNEDIGVLYEASPDTEIRFMVIDIDNVN